MKEIAAIICVCLVSVVLAIYFPVFNFSKKQELQDWNVNSQERIAKRVRRLEVKMLRLTQDFGIKWVDHENGIAWGSWAVDDG